MKNIKIIIIVVVLVVVLGGGYFVYTVVQDNQKAEEMAAAKVKADQQKEQEILAVEASLKARTKCPTVSGYFVVTLDRDGGVGQDILVKQKTDGQVCTYVVVGEDFEIKNTDPEYFKALGANALVTDIGTGPSGRSFRLYDLTDKKLVTEKQYFGDLKVASTTLTYIGLAKAKADAKNCKDFKKFETDDLTPNLVIEKTIDLKTYSVKEGKTTSCVASQ